MACEILACCQFFNDKMKELPKSAEYIKNKVCLGNYESCARFRIYKEFGGEHIPFDLYPDDNYEEVKKVIQCLRNKQMSED
jgi:hypothetical protein